MRLWPLLAPLIFAGACGNPAASRPMTAPRSARAPDAVGEAGAAATSHVVSGSFTEPGAREEITLAIERGDEGGDQAILVLRGGDSEEIARLLADDQPADTSFEATWSLVGPVPLGETGRSGVALLRHSVDEDASGLAAELSELTLYAAEGARLERVHSESADRIRVELDGALLRVTLIERLGGGPQGEQIAESQVNLAWRGRGFAEAP